MSNGIDIDFNTLDINKIQLSKESNKNTKKNFTRFYEIKYGNKNLLIKTDEFSYGELTFNTPFVQFNKIQKEPDQKQENVKKHFIMMKKKYNPSDDKNIKIEIDSDDSDFTNDEIYDSELGQNIPMGKKKKFNTDNNINENEITVSDNMINKLNEITKNLSDRLRPFSKIPDYVPQKKYKLTLYSNDDILQNILHNNNKNIGIDKMSLNKILEKCKIRLILQPKSLIIMDTYIYMNVKVNRLLVDDFSKIDNNNILMSIMNKIHSDSLNNMKKIKELETVEINRKYYNKKDIKNDILKLL